MSLVKISNVSNVKGDNGCLKPGLLILELRFLTSCLNYLFVLLNFKGKYHSPLPLGPSSSRHCTCRYKEQLFNHSYIPAQLQILNVRYTKKYRIPVPKKYVVIVICICCIRGSHTNGILTFILFICGRKENPFWPC